MTLEKPDTSYYTIGYSKRTLDEFLYALSSRGIATLVDVRNAPVSRHRPQFSKRNLQQALQAQGIAYVHMPSLGIPKPIRTQLATTSDHEELLSWYDENVIPNLVESLRSYISDKEGLPVAFMCMEEDPAQCHRSRIAAALNRMGLACEEIQ